MGAETIEEGGFVEKAHVIYNDALDALELEAHVAGSPAAEPDVRVDAATAPLGAQGAKQVASVDVVIDLGERGSFGDVGRVVRVLRAIAEVIEQRADH
jgi:hypothetical protein